MTFFMKSQIFILYEAYYQALQSLNVKVGQFYLTINMLLTKNAEKLGTETFIKETYDVDDAEAWARSHVNELNATEKAAKDVEHFVHFSTNELIPAGNTKGNGWNNQAFQRIIIITQNITLLTKNI